MSSAFTTFGEACNDSSDYEPSENSDDSEYITVSERKVDFEFEDNDDAFQAIASNGNYFSE